MTARERTAWVMNESADGYDNLAVLIERALLDTIEECAKVAEGILHEEYGATNDYLAQCRYAKTVAAEIRKMGVGSGCK